MTIYNDQVSSYISSLFAIEDEHLLRAREDSPKRGLPTINIKPEEGRFLQLLVRTCGAKKVVEIGTLGGYSGSWIARGLLPPVEIPIGVGTRRQCVADGLVHVVVGGLQKGLPIERGLLRDQFGMSDGWIR